MDFGLQVLLRREELKFYGQERGKVTAGEDTLGGMRWEEGEVRGVANWLDGRHLSAS